MFSSQTSSFELLQELSNDPDNEELLDDIGRRFTNSSYNEELADAISAVIGGKKSLGKRALKRPVISSPLTWSNCIGEQRCKARQIRHPDCCQDLVNAVNDGRAQGLTVRAVGSGHSISDVALTDGILLDPKSMKKVIPLDISSLFEPLRGSSLFSVESGITIRELNDELDKRSLALVNMGAFDGQTLAGAISTGTHGTGLGLGPMASNVQSLVVVSETGSIYQIEPSNGITDPVKFTSRNPGIELIQDDDCFQSSVVAMGCMGLIYSYTLDVLPSFFLRESRSLDTWESLKLHFLHGSQSPLLTSHRHFEIDINPYAVNGVHSCVKIVRDVDNGPTHGEKGLKNWLSCLLAKFSVEGSLVDFFNQFPKLVPAGINETLVALVDVDCVGTSHEIMDLGAVHDVKVQALELSFDARNFVSSIDDLLAVFAQAAQNDDWYVSGPIIVRFVEHSAAYLAPQEGRDTCMVELNVLMGINNGESLLRAVKERMCVKGSGVRVHWGLDLDTVSASEMHDMFPKFDRWLSVYRQMNSSGIFDNAFTKRLNISMGMTS
ncbi:hypothetical protein MMC07_007419 [Pseudocyphellaria aurata]|nr:hypothetical protein [Pseudocyphellaria aurata]